MKSDDMIHDNQDNNTGLNTDDDIRLSTGCSSTRNSSIDYKRMITVHLYDTLDSKSIDFIVDSDTNAEEICQQIRIQTDPETIDLRCFSLVLIISILKTYNNSYLHYLRTLKNHECLNEIKQEVIDKQMQQFHQRDKSSLDVTSRWYFKDIRTNPIELNESGDIMGETSSDDEEEISQSDLSYLAKSERKGYLLKRSNTDSNLWRKWYCVLLDQLWCIDITKEVPTCKCIKLTGMIRYKEGYRVLDQLQIIIINSDNLSHYFRAFNIVEQRSWIQDLNDKTNQLPENNFFSIAEVIIADEEKARCQRVMKQLDGVLDGTKMIEALGLHKSIDLSRLSSGVTSDYCSSFEDGGTYEKGNRPLLSTNNKYNNSNSNSSSPSTGKIHNTNAIQLTKNNYNHNYISNYNRGHKEDDDKNNLDNNGIDVLDNSSDGILSIGTTSDSLSSKLPHLKGDRNIISSSPTHHCNIYDHDDDDHHHGHHHEDKQYHSNCISITNTNRKQEEGVGLVDLSNYNMCNHLEQTGLIYRLYRENKSLFEIIQFIIHVQRFRELFRHELSIPASVQRHYARDLYIMYLLPQLQLSEIELSEQFHDHIIKLEGGEILNRQQQQLSGQQLTKKRCDYWGIDDMELLRIHQSVCLFYFNATVSIHDLTTVNVTGQNLVNQQQEQQQQQANDRNNVIHDGQQSIKNDNNQIDEQVTLRSPTSVSNDPSGNTKGSITIDSRGNQALLNAPRQTSSLSSSFWSNWFHPNTINNTSSSGGGGRNSGSSRSLLFSSKPTNTTTNTPSSFSPDTSPRTMIWREVSSSKSHPSSISDEDNNLTAPDVELFDSVLRILYERLS
jgi:hypothetical protein